VKSRITHSIASNKTKIAIKEIKQANSVLKNLLSYVWTQMFKNEQKDENQIITSSLSTLAEE